MAQNQISITTGVTTHGDVLSGMNANFADSETRFTDLESLSGTYVASGDNVSLLTNDAGYSLDSDSIPQLISSVSSGLTLDASLGYNANTTLTEDVTGFSITNTTSGDSGLIIVEQDATGSWTFASTYDVLAGDLADIASITASGSGVGSIGWYNDGTDNYLFVSNVT